MVSEQQTTVAPGERTTPPDTTGERKTPASSLVALLSQQRTALLIIAGGIIIRLYHYLANKSIWIDEYQLMRNIINRPFPELLKPLDYDQGAPLLFLFIEKSSTLLFGVNEYALRLFPLLAGIISLFLFYGLARAYLRTEAVPIALGLFATGYSLIYYSVETKQYASDVMVTLLLMLLATRLTQKRLSVWGVAGFALASAVSVWLSHPAIFTLAGIGATLGLTYLINKDWRRFAKIVSVGVVFSLSFLACYLISLRPLGKNEFLLRFWDEGFAPFPPTSLADLLWYPKTFLVFFVYPVGLPIFSIGVVAALAGAFVLHQRNKPIILLITPFLFTFLAAHIHAYPFAERLVLFLIPLVLLFVAEGLVYIRGRLSSSSVIERNFPLVVSFAYAVIPLAFLLGGKTLSTIWARGYGLLWINVLSLVAIALLSMHEHKRIAAASRMALMTALVVVGVYEGALLSKNVAQRFVMPEWRYIASVIEQQRLPDEPVITMIWDALPLDYYLDEDTPFLRYGEFLDVANEWEAGKHYLIVYSENSTYRMPFDFGITLSSEWRFPPAEKVDTVLYDMSGRNVRVVRYTMLDAPL